MKRLFFVVAIVAMACFSTQLFAGDKAAISKNVDEVVAAIDGGKDPASFAADAYTPYVFIMEKDGMLLVHPSLAGKDLKTEAMAIYEALQAASAEGVWLKYEWKGKEKNTYAKATTNNLIVASGY